MNVLEKAIHVTQPSNFPGHRRRSAANVPLIETSAPARVDRSERIDDFDFVNERERVFLTRIRARTSTRMLALVARALAASHAASVGRNAVRHPDLAPLLEAAAIYRNVDIAVGAGMPAGYAFVARFADVLAFILERTRWSIAAFAFHTLATMRAFSLPPEPGFARHASAVHRIGQGSELALNQSANEWRLVSAALAVHERQAAVDDLIVLMQGIDALLLFQADADARYLMANSPRSMTARQTDQVADVLLHAYRALHIDGAMEAGPFAQLLHSFMAPADLHRLRVELAWPTSTVRATVN